MYLVVRNIGKKYNKRLVMILVYFIFYVIYGLWVIKNL